MLTLLLSRHAICITSPKLALLNLPLLLSSTRLIFHGFLHFLSHCEQPERLRAAAKREHLCVKFFSSQCVKHMSCESK